MTLLEKLRKEGEERGIVKGEERGIVKGKKKGIIGLREAIEEGASVKFPENKDTVMAKVNETDDLDTLVEVAKRIYTANGISEILSLLK